MTVGNKLVSEDEAQRAKLEKKLQAKLNKPMSTANIKRMKNDRLIYKNLDAHVLSLLIMLEIELKTSLV